MGVATDRFGYLKDHPEPERNNADLVVWTYVADISHHSKPRSRPSEIEVWAQARLKMPAKEEVYREVYRAIAGARPVIMRVAGPTEDYRGFNCRDTKELDSFLRNHRRDFENIAAKFNFYAEQEEFGPQHWLMRCYCEQPLLREMREAREEAEAEYERRRVFGDFAKMLKGMRGSDG